MRAPEAPPAGERDGGARPPRRQDGRVVLAIVAPLAVSPLVLTLMDREATLFGVPVLIAYIFFAWTVGIAITWRLARGRAR